MKRIMSKCIKLLSFIFIVFILSGKITSVEAASYKVPPMNGYVYFNELKWGPWGDLTSSNVPAGTFNYELYHNPDYPDENDPTNGEHFYFSNADKGVIDWYNHIGDPEFEVSSNVYHYILKQLPNDKYEIAEGFSDTIYFVIDASGNWGPVARPIVDAGSNKGYMAFVNVEKPITPELSIDKIVSNKAPSVGDKIKYTIKASQIVEGAIAKNTIITDEIPSGIKLVEDSVEVKGLNEDEYKLSTDNGKITITILVDLEKDKEIEISYDVIVLESAAGKTIKNSASVKADNADKKETNVNITVNKVKNEEVEKEKPSKEKPNPETGDNILFKVLTFISASVVFVISINKKIRFKLLEAFK